MRQRDVQGLEGTERPPSLPPDGRRLPAAVQAVHLAGEDARLRRAVPRDDPANHNVARQQGGCLDHHPVHPVHTAQATGVQRPHPPRPPPPPHPASHPPPPPPTPLP